MRKMCPDGDSTSLLGHMGDTFASADPAGRNNRLCAAISRADAGTRTPDPFITNEVLYQLSYVGAGAA